MQLEFRLRLERAGRALNWVKEVKHWLKKMWVKGYRVRDRWKVEFQGSSRWLEGQEADRRSKGKKGSWKAMQCKQNSSRYVVFLALFALGINLVRFNHIYSSVCLKSCPVYRMKIHIVPFVRTVVRSRTILALVIHFEKQNPFVVGKKTEKCVKFVPWAMILSDAAFRM